MTAYQGGKKRLGKRISDVIKQVEIDGCKENLDYIEPFCGMCGVLVHMVDGKRKIEASDINKDLILMWKAVQDGWLPEDKEITKDEFEKMKLQTIHSKERGFYGVVCSFGNDYFGTYRNNNIQQDYVKIGINNINSIKDKTVNITFEHKSYIDIRNINNKLIYCDPPYLNNNLKNKLFRKFDHLLFWNTMREWSKDNIVIISEREAPDDFKCIWEQEYTTSTNNNNNRKTHTEKLFIYKFN